jgi:FMN phosphatase YigB (HAD superfamily)
MEKNNSNIPDITFSGDITVNGPMFDIHDNEHVYIGRPDKRVTKINDSGVKKENVERNEERFHFVHPEIEDEEAWRIHQSIKRLVAYQKIPEICAYLKELKQKGKVLLPSVAAVMYNELVRLGMPTGDGYSEKHFSNSYTK